MNPLSIPFGVKPKPPPEVQLPPVPNFIGVRNEVARDLRPASVRIKVQVQGVKGQPNATYEVEYRAGSPLKEYLEQLKLRHVAMTAAVRDQSNLSLGRLRLHYIPTQQSHITLGNPSVSSAMQFQRTRVDAQTVARTMGGGQQTVERKLR